MTAPRFLIPISFSLVIAAFFTATQPITPAMSVVSSIFVIIFALPSYFAVIKVAGWKWGLLTLAAFGVYALAIESSAIHTGFPYGDFIYNDLLGQKVLDLTPWTVAFAWPPILLLAYTYTHNSFRNIKAVKSLPAFLLIVGLMAMAIDLVLDPAAVSLGFWEWVKPGRYYGVPLVNFMGWVLSGTVGALIFWALWKDKNISKEFMYSGLAIVWFWTWVNLFLLQLIPFFIGIFLLHIFIRSIDD